MASPSFFCSLKHRKSMKSSCGIKYRNWEKLLIAGIISKVNLWRKVTDPDTTYFTGKGIPPRVLVRPEEVTGRKRPPRVTHPSTVESIPDRLPIIWMRKLHVHEVGQIQLAVITVWTWITWTAIIEVVFPMWHTPEVEVVRGTVAVATNRFGEKVSHPPQEGLTQRDT